MSDPATGLKPYTIFLDPALHNAMKEIARRNKRTLGGTYEEALEFFINQTNNYLGKIEKKSKKDDQN